MKTLKDHVILYDQECPLCSVYTGAFVKSGMLSGNGRQPYQQAGPGLCSRIDRQRAVDEIALVNTTTGQVTYGVHSLFKIIANSFPMLSGLFSFKPFVWLMTRLYAFISYNRRVIIPSAGRITFDTQPSFSLSHRIAYLMLTCLAAAWILSHYAPLLSPFVPLGDPYREYWVCAGQVLFQGVVIACYKPHKIWEYLGNMMTISFGASLLLLLAMLMAKVIEPPAMAYTLYFLLVAGLMLLEHIRRSRLMRIGNLLTVTWILYRLIVLIMIFKLG